MTASVRVAMSPPYLLFLGDAPQATYAKTAMGLAHWRPQHCLAQLRLPTCGADAGLPDMTPAAAARAGAKTLVIGVAPVGGRVPPEWMDVLLQAAGAGLDVAGGLHTRLEHLPSLVEAARTAGTRLIDVRVPPPDIPVATGRKRTGLRLLTVGTDCAIGKKYTALALEGEMLARGMDATFRATGQTGIMIAGEGIPIDAVVADFLAGAAEALSPDNDPGHWDVIEGQGGLFHPGYAGVTLGLLHGSQPDAFVVCHELGRVCIEGWPDCPLPDVPRLIEQTCRLGALTNPAIRCVGVAVNSSGVAGAERVAAMRAIEETAQVPCVDPLIDGVGRIVDLIEATPR